MSEENKCPLCGQNNPDVLEDHLVALSGDYDYYGSPVILHLCVNCHRAIHRCCWALISQYSEAVLAKYFSFLESLLPFSLFSPIFPDQVFGASYGYWTNPLELLRKL